MGMLSRFISGAAGAGADILASQIKGDAEEASAIRRAQAGADIKAASDEKVRAQMAARYAEYAKPVEGMVKGAATAVDDEGNSTAPNDFKESRDPTYDEMAMRGLKGGEPQFAGMMSTMSHRADADTELKRRNEIRQELGAAGIAQKDKASERSLEGKKLTLEERMNEAKMKYYDKDGNLKPSPGIEIANINTYRDRIKDNNTNISALNKVLTKVDASETFMSPADIQKRKDQLEALKADNAVLNDILTKKTDAKLAPASTKTGDGIDMAKVEETRKKLQSNFGKR